MDTGDTLFAAFVKAIGPSTKSPTIARLIKENLKLRETRRQLKKK